jgi:hypothetical protein
MHGATSKGLVAGEHDLFRMIEPSTDEMSKLIAKLGRSDHPKSRALYTFFTPAYLI